MADWIDEEKARRDKGERRALSQDAHAAVNARYPGLTRQKCTACGAETGRCEDDSIYVDEWDGPVCESCGQHWRLSQ
jgi:MinD superfamily P-loop ATPase